MKCNEMKSAFSLLVDIHYNIVQATTVLTSKNLKALYEYKLYNLQLLWFIMTNRVTSLTI